MLQGGQQFSFGGHTGRIMNSIAGCSIDLGRPEGATLTVVVDRDGQIVHASHSVSEMTGCGLCDLFGKVYWDIFIPAGSRNEEKTWFLSIRDGKNEPLHHSAWVKLDGSLCRVCVSLTRLHDVDTKVVHVILTAVPLREKALEESLSLKERQKLEEQLRQAQKLDTIGRLTSGIAQEFNNLLSPVLGYSELALQDLEKGTPLHNDLIEIRNASIRGRDLVRSLLSFSSEQELSMEVICLNDVIDVFSRLLRNVLREDIEIELRLAPTLGYVYADAQQVEQIVMNLAVNARDAMPSGGVLTIETSNVFFSEDYASHRVEIPPGAYCMFSVSDTGTGFDEDTKRHIFDPFFTTHEQGRRTGLGLATVHGSVKQHGGVILPYSEVGQGTTFKVYLPRVEEDGQPVASVVQDHDDTPGTETILVVEDDAIVRKLAREALGDRGYQIVTCASPEEALLAASEYEGEIHLLLTDVIMPQMNGEALFRKIKERLPEVKVVYMSGYAENVIAAHGVLEPGIEFVQKPFSVYDLNRAVRRVLDEG